MKLQLPFFLILCLNLIASPIQADEKSHLIFTSFRVNGQDGLHLFYSNDGLNWRQLNKDQSFLKPEIGQDKLMRDPCIIQGPNGIYHMVWTPSWHARYIGYASSKDLIHWSEQKQLNVMDYEPTAKNAWAPELYYDSKLKKYFILWASTIPGRFQDAAKNPKENHNDNRMYYTTTTDFQSFSPTKLFFDPGHTVIDATITKQGELYYLVYKDETLVPKPEKSLKLATSKSPYGPWKYDNKSITRNWVEGPSLLKWKDQFILYYDEYTRHRYGASSTTDWENWNEMGDQLKFPAGHRHGTVLKISGDVARKLLAYSPE